MIQVKKWLHYASAVAILSAIVPSAVLADGKESAFMISPVFPENQTQERSGYFNLNVKPEVKQTIYIQIVNNTQTRMEYEVKIGNALTTQNGGIQYVPNKGSDKTSLLDEKYLIDKYVKVQDSIVIEPNSVTKLPIEITTPKDKSGSYLGAILFKNKNQNTKQDNSQTFQFVQEVYLGIGVQLNLSPPTKDYDIEFGKSDVKFHPSATQIDIETINTKAEVIKGLSGEYKVYDGEGKLLFGDTIKEFDMAPMSKVDYSINWDANTIANEDYQLEFMLTDGKETFKYSEKIEVKKEDLKILENREKAKKNNPKPNLNTAFTDYLLYGLIFSLIGIIMFLIRKGKKKDGGESDKE